MNINEISYWNSRSYGSAIVFKKNWLKTLLILFCLLTPATNWLVPFVSKLVTKDYKITYEVRNNE